MTACPDKASAVPAGRHRRLLARGLLVAAILIVLGATLLPSEPAGQIDWAQVFCLLCGRAALADGLANIALFLPLGVALGLLRYAPRRALLWIATMSVFVEVAQFAIPGRDPSLSDVIFNTLGAALGGGTVRLTPRLARPRARVASRLSLLAAAVAGAVFTLTGVLLTASLPETSYFGGSAYVQSSERPLRLGGNTEPGGYFQGLIDEVRIYKGARTASEIEGDMSMPVAAAPRSSDLVAAYSFDESSGSELIDISGHGNTGEIHGANWTSQGRFAGALEFNGAGDVVVIPHHRSLDLTGSMTLEAWIYPTAAQTGWRAILQKEFDTYFLLASSRAGALKPSGGGTFGSSTEIMAAPAEVPTRAWTHVALTYDQAALRLYIDGSLVMRRLRWYPGHVVEASLDGVTIPAGINADSRRLRARLLAGAPLRVRAVAARPVSGQAPFVTLHDPVRNELLLLAAEGDDVVFRLRTRAAAAGLDSPAIRARGVMRNAVPGDALVVTIWRAGRTYCVHVNTHATCGLGVTLGTGWGLLFYSQVPPGWPHAVLNLVWMAALLFPFGFWLRRRWESALGGTLLAISVVVLCTIGNLNGPPAEVAAAMLGILAGRACGSRLARTTPGQPTQELRCRAQD